MELYVVEDLKVKSLFYALELKNENYYIIINYDDVQNNFGKDFDFLIHYRKKEDINGKFNKINMDIKILRYMFFYVFNMNLDFEMHDKSLDELLMFINGEEY